MGCLLTIVGRRALKIHQRLFFSGIFMIDLKEYTDIDIENPERAHQSVKDLAVNIDDIFEIQDGQLLVYENDKYYVKYFDIFFAGYDTRTMKMERTVYNKKTKESSFWRTSHRHPQKFIDEFNLGEDKELNFPSSNEEMNHLHDRWILEKLAEEESWGYF